MQAAKGENEKNALAQAAQTAGRSDKVDAEILARQEQLDKQREGEKGRQQHLAEALLHEKGEDVRTQAHLKNAKDVANIQGYYHLKGQKAAGGGGTKLSEQQERTLTLLPTMIQANKMAGSLEQAKGGPPQQHAVANAFKAMAPKSMESEPYRAYHTAATLWTGSYLFKVSGAAGPEQEIGRYTPSFFASPGDSPDLIRQKAAMRETIQRVMHSTLDQAPSTIQAELVREGIPKELLPPVATEMEGHTAITAPEKMDYVVWKK